MSDAVFIDKLNDEYRNDYRELLVLHDEMLPLINKNNEQFNKAKRALKSVLGFALKGYLLKQGEKDLPV